MPTNCPRNPNLVLVRVVAVVLSVLLLFFCAEPVARCRRRLGPKFLPQRSNSPLARRFQPHRVLPWTMTMIARSTLSMSALPLYGCCFL